MTKPTRETVEEMLNDFEAHELIGSRRDVYELVVNVFKDWLAQEEELEKVGCMLVEMTQKHIELQGHAQSLLAENQALKASMEADYIERQAKHIQALVKENGELKEKVEWFKNECEKDLSIIDELREQKRKLEAYMAEVEGYQP